MNIKKKDHFLKEGNSDVSLWMQWAWTPLCCHGNVKNDMPWNFVISITTVQSFSSMDKMSSEIFHFLFYIIL